MLLSTLIWLRFDISSYFETSKYIYDDFHLHQRLDQTRITHFGMSARDLDRGTTAARSPATKALKESFHCWQTKYLSYDGNIFH
mmetsp:Transcript_28161/g.51292  ORF Transcript_28161/g.51292 Transcript_28161/m.51292 type:complete len:84 (+) Transcript_28161:149-400(+)